MPELTPAERRGALWLVALLLVGTLHDLIRARSPREAPPAGSYFPSAGVPATPHVGTLEARPQAGDSLTDLNRASLAELDRLPGIGPVLARRIVEHRERHGAFRSPDELLAVPGIGPRLFERLRPRVITRP